jgi:hypothetical protein
MFAAAGFSAEVDENLGASPLDVALGVAWVEGDGNAASDRFKTPAVYADAVGDLDKIDAKWGPSISHFQIRTLRDAMSGNEADRWRVASRLTNPADPAAAAWYACRAAYVISKNGADFTPWSAFKSNSYLLYLGKDYDLVTGHPRAGDWSK